MTEARQEGCAGEAGGCGEYRVVTPCHVAALVASGATDVLLLDVRTPREFAACRLPGAVLLPVQELADRWRELDPDRPTVCVCEHGIRSEGAADFLAHHGFADVSTMCGGMVRWNGPVEHGG